MKNCGRRLQQHQEEWFYNPNLGDFGYKKRERERMWERERERENVRERERERERECDRDSNNPGKDKLYILSNNLLIGIQKICQFIHGIRLD